MPKVTLLRPASTYALKIGRTMFEFKAGRAKEVPVAVALAAQKKKHRGEPLFKISGLPKVVARPEQNGTAIAGQQRLPV